MGKTRNSGQGVATYAVIGAGRRQDGAAAMRPAVRTGCH